ncbi:4-hydroxy-2-oxovalerate aldolase [Fluoribacter gormanii]|uniref:Homocitrate synthase n=1 Tax=Fluoribacter gormanii TaxID=464 RepID=A0A377GG56_9GAMM|nr:4-hydroxy-2-oxovalerate aldolase [Fluoribacter gormanii]KTD01634.1 4-hydroxy-2-oxovalerate aldolase [Fluoribacter gormanii]SIR65722.1 4-hydroxy 2-oxovalerate aldolase [Fluoribacter gormanii]STO23515.1 4-hydroxy-2-oxovalerate aldolase 4 [Fluoribacter gormanii]
MLDPIVLLDASLRDGGHRTNFNFEDIQLERILSPLDNSGIEYIEIGYRNGTLSPLQVGRAGWCAKDYLLFCRSLIQKAKMAVMVFPNNLTQTDLMELKECGVDLLRVCIAKNELASALPKIKIAKKANMEISVNLMCISYYKENELDDSIKQISEYEPDIIYFADSNGSLLPTRTKEIYEKYINNYPFQFGFHAHDNLGLAQANALAAMSTGVRFIDASLAGMGKGIGNLKTEFFVAYLHSIQLKKYNLDSILEAANFVRSSLKIGQEPVEMSEFIRGISDLSIAHHKATK